MRVVGCMLVVMVLAVPYVFASQPISFTQTELNKAFKGSQAVDLATSKVNSVVTLREKVKIPPPNDVVLVKTFRRESLPQVLRPAFAKKEVVGVTIRNRYVAIIYTDIPEEYQDILAHELVHAYISLTSPKPLPFWFQEGSAVNFSTGKVWKFYGQPSKDQIGVMVGKKVEITDTYKQKLHSFQYLIEKVGEKRFNQWYRNAVESGNVDARQLLGLSRNDKGRHENRKGFPIWVLILAGVVIVVVIAAGLYCTRGDSEYL